MSVDLGSLALGLFAGCLIGMFIMNAITPYCCRLQPELEDDE